MDATSGLTASGAFVGTLDYSAPEQIRGGRLDARTDVYALACVTFELLSGDAPFASQEEQVAKLYAHLQEPPPQLATVASGVPLELSDVIERAMAKDPGDRHPSAGDFARAAAAAVEGRAPVAPERNVGVGAAAPTQTLETLAPEKPVETVEAEMPLTRESEVPSEALDKPTLEARSPAAPATRRLPRGPLIAAVLAVAGLAVGAWALLGTGSPEEGTERGLREEGASGALASGASFEVPAEPVGIAINAGTVWVTSAGEESLTRLDAETGEEVGKQLDLGGAGGQVTFTEDGDAWVAVAQGSGAGYVLRLSADGGQIAKIPVGSGPTGIAAGVNFVWVANSGAGSASRLNLEANAADLSIPGLTEPARVVAGNADREGTQLAKGIWITNSAGDSVTRITAEGDVVSTLDGVGANPVGVAVAGDDLVWIAAQDGNTLAQINPVEEPVSGGPAGEVGKTVRFKEEDCVGPGSLAVGFGSVWATCAVSDTVVRVDQTTGAFQGSSREVGAAPRRDRDR